MTKISIERILILLLTIIIFVQFCNTPDVVNQEKKELIDVDGKKYEVLDKKTDTTTVKKITEGTNTELKPKIIIVPKIEYIQTPVDTNEILKDYYSKKVYSDVIYLADSVGKVLITDTISENEIKTRTFTSEINQKTITNTIIVKEPPKNQIYYGVNTSFDKKQFISSVSTGVLIKNKKDKIYSLKIGLRNNSVIDSQTEPYVEGGLYWLLKFKKK